MQKKIANITLKTPLIIAPMAGVTNAAFRKLCNEFGAGLVCSEMVSDKAIFYENAKTLDMLKLDNDVHPISLQIFGSDPKTMAYASRYVSENTCCDIIDINMGCPVNKVVKTGAGSALMKDEDLAVEVTKSVLENTNKPVTVKMRLGFDNKSQNYLSLAKKLENIGVSAITLHARTRSQMYEGSANWEAIKALKQELKIPLIGNGDIKTLSDYIKYKDYADMIMVGRGIIGNPFLIKEIADFENGVPFENITYLDRIRMCLRHTQNLIELKGEKVAIREMRGLAPHYISGLYKSTVYKNYLSKINTYKDMEDLFKEYIEVLKGVSL